MKLIFAALIALAALCAPAMARDGYDQNGRPLVCDPAELGEGTADFLQCRAWISNVKQPTNIMTCCGEAEAYIADGFRRTPEGGLIAIISRDYPASEVSDGMDGMVPVPAVPKGTEIPIPNDRLDIKHQGNPTGHGIVFFNWSYDGVPQVLCYFSPTLS